jgi:hypothetical protein
MCDYSLHGLPNRLAVEGEGLVTYRFPTGSGGLAPPTDIASANRPNPRGECRRSWWSALKDGWTRRWNSTKSRPYASLRGLTCS